MPQLNLCVKRRGLKLWHCRVEESTIDFDMVKEGPQAALKQVEDAAYNMSKGPLWKIRMAHLSPGEASPRGVVAKHQSLIALGIHHSISDATSNMFMLKELVRVLNDLLAEIPITITAYPLGRPLPTSSYIKNTMFFIIEFILRISVLVYYMLFESMFNTFRVSHPLSYDEQNETKNISHVFSQEVSQKLLAKCKENKVTLNSCFNTALNVSFQDIQKEKGNPEEYSCRITTVLNTRLHRNPQKGETHLGSHATGIEQAIPVTKKLKENFWSSAKAYGDSIRRNIAERTFVKYFPLIKFMVIIAFVNELKQTFNFPNVIEAYYLSTNIGEMSSSFKEPDPNDRIQVVDVTFSTTASKSAHLTIVLLHSFRKRLYVQLNYYNNRMNDDDAKRYFSILKSNIIQIAEKGYLN